MSQSSIDWNASTIQLKLKVVDSRYKVPVILQRISENKLEVQFRYNPKLLDEIRVMEGARYHGFDEFKPKKVWTIFDSLHNRFQLEFLAGGNPYANWEKDLLPYESKRKNPSPYSHQILMTRTGITYHWVIWAAEMGTGKSLSAIETVEWFIEHNPEWFSNKDKEILWIGPRSALYQVQNEFRKWKAKFWPEFLTYEGLKKVITSWPKGKSAPRIVIFDESSRLKNSTSQRSQAAQHLSDAMRQEYGQDCIIIEMSGSPAPNNPTDWFSQCRVACPGFLREGNIIKFKQRLALIQQRESDAGGKYPHLITWKDDEKKCDKCGEVEEALNHQPEMTGTSDYHPFIKSVNEVAYLYKRMTGLVHVWFKKDCLDLPDKVFKIIECKPTVSILNAAKIIAAKAPNSAQALILLRELSDGFQYSEKEIGKQKCELCKGKKTFQIPYNENNPDELITDEVLNELVQRPGNIKLSYREEPCPSCKGTGQTVKTVRIVNEVPCPKEAALKNLIDEHDDVGRIVIYAGFTGSVDRCTRICREVGWETIRVDGRGWQSSIGGNPTGLLEIFQEHKKQHPRVAFIGQPGAAGMGLNLTASPSEVFYSNDFNAESRIQAIDRIHRPGMDLNRGATIYDLVHLPTDRKVLDRLQMKMDLQAMTLGEMKQVLDTFVPGQYSFQGEV